MLRVTIRSVITVSRPLISKLTIRVVTLSTSLHLSSYILLYNQLNANEERQFSILVLVDIASSDISYERNDPCPNPRSFSHVRRELYPNLKMAPLPRPDGRRSTCALTKDSNFIQSAALLNLLLWNFPPGNGSASEAVGGKLHLGHFGERERESPTRGYKSTRNISGGGICRFLG